MGNIKDVFNALDSDKQPTAPGKPQEPSFKLVARGRGDFKTVYRPQKFDELAPTCSIEQLRCFVDNPHSSRIFLFEGGTGTGKTTCARIVAKANVCLSNDKEEKPCLNCKNCKNFDSSMDVLEINIADKRKIEDARQLVTEMSYRPQFLNKKIYILDEVQQLTPEAQQVLLKHLEEPKDYVWVFLCTTNKQGLDKALIDRANTVTFHQPDNKEANVIIEQILLKHNKTATPELKLSFINNAQGSVRALLNILQTYIEGGYDPDHISVADEEMPGIPDLFQAIMSGKWALVVPILKRSEFRNHPEKTRISLQSYVRGCLLGDPSRDKQGNNIRFGPMLDVLAAPLRLLEYNDLVLRCFKLFEIGCTFKKT